MFTVISDFAVCCSRFAICNANETDRRAPRRAAPRASRIDNPDDNGANSAGFKEFALHRRRRVVFDVDRTRESSIGYTRAIPANGGNGPNRLSFTLRPFERASVTFELKNARCNAKNTIASRQSGAEVLTFVSTFCLFYHAEKNRIV